MLGRMLLAGFGGAGTVEAFSLTRQVPTIKGTRAPY